MRRWLFTILLFLLLGSVVNVAVAWGCAAFVPLSHDRSGLSSLDFGYKWAIERWSGLGAIRLWSHTWCGMSDRVMKDVSAERLVVPWSRIRRPEPVRADRYRGETIVDGIRISVPVNQQMIDDARGLPCLSLRCGWGTPALVTADPPSCWAGSCDWGIELISPDSDPTSGKALPLRPIWPGFLINTLFYALVLWLLICGPFVLRRLIRRKSDQSPKGGYDLRGKLGRLFRMSVQSVRAGAVVKRGILSVLLLLLLGAVVNIAVACGCALWASAPVGDTDWHRLEDQLWLDTVDEGPRWEALNLHVRRGEGFGLERVEIWAYRDLGPYSPGPVFYARDTCLAERTLTGWPALSFSGGRYNRAYGTAAGRAKPTEWTLITALKTPWPEDNTTASRANVVPFRPLWRGFIGNTLFYTVILWLLISGPFILRRHIRLKRGRCPKCGYDLRGQPPEDGAGAAGCPECGWNRQPEAVT